MFDAKGFSELLKTAIGSNRSITDFAKACNVVRPYISKFLNCKLDKAPSLEVITKFANAAANNVQETAFLQAAGFLTPEDWEDNQNILFASFEGMGAAVTGTRNKLKLRELQNHKNDLTAAPVKIPILSFIDPTTIISLDEGNIVGYDYIPATNKYDATKCFYHLSNDQSMINARIHEGDRVLIVPDKPYQHNDIVLILKDDESFLRRYKKLNSINLFQAENNDFDSFDITNADLKKSVITIIGTIEEVKIITPL